MRTETSARELALKALYQRDVMRGRDFDELREFCDSMAGPEVSHLAMGLVEGCVEELDEVDAIIEETARNWKLSRMPATDRNILRLGVYELLFRSETPPKVAINEAIELAKKYSTENSPTFVNGVLDKIYNVHVREPESGEAAMIARGGRARLIQALRPDPESRADLHTHSTASDGSVEPEDLPPMASKAGLAAFALTDHDSVQGLAACAAAAREFGIEVVPGVELTGYERGPEGEIEVHIAGLFVDPSSEVLRDRLAELRESRVERVRHMAERLTELGMPVEAEDVLKRASGGAVGRVHVAQELEELGHVGDLREAFDRYLGEGCPAYVPKQKLTPAQAIQLVRAAGGVSVLCHPQFIDDLEELLASLAEDGLDAIEAHYPTHGPEQKKRLRELAEEFGLAVTGGSDFHGDAKPHISIGQEFVSFVELAEIQRRAAERT